MQEIWTQLRDWVVCRRAFVLATVVKTSGSSPRGIGSVVAIADDNRFIGSVSGGCVENSVIELARRVMEDGKPRSAEFGPEQGLPWEVALSCGGTIEVRLEPFEYDDVVTPELTTLLDEHRRGLWISAQGKQILFAGDGRLVGDASQWSPETLVLARRHHEAGAPTTEIETPDGRVLFSASARPRRLFIVGAVHIAVHLVSFARALGYQTMVIDPRSAYAKAERFNC